MNKVIYLDTNVFLHYQPFNQINWLEVVKAESVIIVFPPVIVRELNKHKDSHPRAQIRKRAGETIKRLYGLLDSGSNPKVAENIYVFFEDRDPTIDFASHQLNFNIQDDHLIASIIMNRQESPTDYIVLVTSDLGLTLVAKAGRQSINTLRMPENLRVADEPDPNEDKVKQLEQQIRELNSRTPNLSLTYEDGRQYTTIKLSKPIILAKSDVEEKMTEVRNKYPKRKKENAQENDHLHQTAIERATMFAAMSPMTIPQKEIDRYNIEVEKYFPAHENFIVKNNEFENRKRRTIKLGVLLANDGTSPAEDIDIYLHFPDGFQLLGENKLPKPPFPPHPPVEPMTEMQMLANSMNYANQLLSSVQYLDNSPTSPTTLSNVSSPKIKRVNSYEVHVHVQKVKHNLQVFLDPLFVIFDEFDTANSFTVDYRILAANIPHEVTGNLHVIIEKIPS
jgi:hypothetical protein